MKLRSLSMVTFSLILLAPVVASAESMSHPIGRNLADIKFEKFPGFPTCASNAVQIAAMA